MKHIDLFAGIGGFSLALDTAFNEQPNEHTFIEWDEFCTEVLKNTGRTQSTTRTSERLLPTPRAREGNSGDRPAGIAHGVKKGYLDATVATLSQEVSLANHSVKLDEDKERQTTAISGLKCLESYSSTSQYGSSLKTLVGSLLGTKAWYSNKCALTWKVKVTKSNRLLFQLYPSMRRTEGIEYGLLPTATTQEVEHPNAELSHTGRRIAKNGNTHSLGLMDRIAMLPTPDAGMGTRGARVYDPQGYNASQRTVNALVTGTSGERTGLKLQPNFVEWMMGFPKDWTEIPDSRLLEMRLSRKLLKKSLKQ